jgi:cell division protein FtsZ
LEGIIRVSVVATGIDKQVSEQPTPATSGATVRAAEMLQRLRPEMIRQPERAEPAERPAAVAAAPAPAPAAVATPEDIEAQAKAAVAAAILQAGQGNEDVTIRPLQRSKPSLLLDPAAPAPQEPAMPPAFIPPAPEQVGNRRMPRFEELPLTAQAEIRAQRGEPQPVDTPERRRMSLLQRLASVGLGRREDDPVAAAPPQPRQPVRQAPPPLERSLQRPPAPRPPETQPDHPSAAYGKRPMQTLDPHGRPIPVHNSSEEDQLEIPAFLRRQAN